MRHNYGLSSLPLALDFDKPLTDGFESKQDILSSLFQSRFKLALFALVIQLLAIYFIIRPFLFTSLFNIPAIIALLLCMNKRSLYDYKAQKKIKLLLKIGMAKAIGGVSLAIYMGLKYAYMPRANGIQSLYSQNQEEYMKLCAIYFVASALVDIFYSFIAKDIVRSTKQIVVILKEKKRQRSPRSLRSNSPRELKSSEPAIPTTEP